MSSLPYDSPRLLALGDGAWTVEFARHIDPAVHGRVMALDALVDDARRHDPAFAGVADTVPTFRSLTVYFRPEPDPLALGERLLALAQTAEATTLTGRHWLLPACFDADFAPDLAAVAERHGMTPAAAIERLCQTAFRVYMIGFMPGFPYMGGLPASLHTPRLSTPRKLVPARSIAIAGEMCAVYPWQSPGGWNLLGQTPLDLFVAGDEPPALLASGDCVRWQAVDRAEYTRIERALATGDLQRRHFLSGEPA